MQQQLTGSTVSGKVPPCTINLLHPEVEKLIGQTLRWVSQEASFAFVFPSALEDGAGHIGQKGCRPHAQPHSAISGHPKMMPRSFLTSGDPLRRHKVLLTEAEPESPTYHFSA